MHKTLLPVLLLFISAHWCIAQTAISGTVTDVTNKEVLPFVNIGIRNKDIGAIADENGKFKINIPAGNVDDTLTFSVVGYNELQLPIKKAAAQNTFALKARLTQLKGVEIKAEKLKEKKYGISKYNPLIHFLDGSMNHDDIFEIAQLVRLGNHKARITSLNLHVNEPRADSGLFRINFYGYDGSRPTHKVVDKNILQKQDIKPGWMHFDLSEYKIDLQGDVVVSLEFIPTKEKNKRIVYEIKLGGSSKSFVRTHSIGKWEVPPHHYRMYITALTTDKRAEDEEKETEATARMYSTYVNDSFSVYVRLPKNYDSRKKYATIYLLDANVFFDGIGGSIKEIYKGRHADEPILVGIGYKDVVLMDSLRDRDYTYPNATPADSLPVSGGANKFLAFIKQELIPYIDGEYATDTNRRSIMGHSLGGYFVLYALEHGIKNNECLFRNYISASPSLEYCQHYLTEQLKHLPATNQQRYVYITVGAREDFEDGVNTGVLAGFDAFTKQLHIEHAKIKAEKFPYYDHMETAIPSFENGLKAIGGIQK